MSKTLSRWGYGTLYLIFGIIGHGVGSCMYDVSNTVYPWEAKNSVQFVNSSGGMMGSGMIPTVLGGGAAAITRIAGCTNPIVSMLISGVTSFGISCPAYTNQVVAYAYYRDIPNAESVGNRMGALRACLAALFQTLFGFAFPLLIRHFRCKQSLMDHKIS